MPYNPFKKTPLREKPEMRPLHARTLMLVAAITVIAIGVLVFAVRSSEHPQASTLTMSPGTTVPNGMLMRSWFHTPNYRYQGTNDDGTTLYFTNTETDEQFAFADVRAGDTLSLPDLRTDLSATIVSVSADDGALTLDVKSW